MEKKAIEKPDLLNLRLGKGWTQQQAADKSGMSRSYYGMIETHSRVPSIAAAQKLAKVFNFNWFAFFEDRKALR